MVYFALFSGSFSTEKISGCVRGRLYFITPFLTLSLSVDIIRKWFELCSLVHTHTRIYIFAERRGNRIPDTCYVNVDDGENSH